MEIGASNLHDLVQQLLKSGAGFRYLKKGVVARHGTIAIISNPVWSRKIFIHEAGVSFRPPQVETSPEGQEIIAMDFQLPQGPQSGVESFVNDSGLPKEIVVDLIDHHTVVPYAKGSALFLRGAPADVLFWVFSGIVELFCPLPDGKRVLIRLCGPGDILGNVDFLNGRGRRVQKYEAYAHTKCEIGLVTREYLFRLLQTLEPTQLIRLIEHINTMWSRVDSSWATFVGSGYRARLESVFEDIAVRLGVEDSRGTLLLPELLHEQLAEMIGCSRPMITHLIDRMEREGVLVRQGKQFVLLNRLKRPGPVLLKQHDGPVQMPAVRTAGGLRDDQTHRPRSSSAISATGRVSKPGKSANLSLRRTTDLPHLWTVGVIEKNKSSSRPRP